MGRKIVISGYYGFDNLGDEAILQSIIKCLKNWQEELHITVLSARPEVTARRYQVKAVKRNSFKDFIKEVKDCDLFISGGGSLLQDITGWKTVPFYLGQVLMAQLMGKPTVLYAQGIGPISKGFNKLLIRFVANRTKLITVRDQKSVEQLLDFGVDEELIKNTVDPVFALAGREWKQGRVLLENEGIKKDKPLVGISVRPWLDNAYLTALARTADYLTTLTGGKVVIIPLHYKQDPPVGRKLLELMDEDAFMLEGDYTPLEMIEVFSELDFLVGVRLHSLIFAAIHNVPFVAINYDPKVESFIREIGVNSQVRIEDLEENILRRVCETVWTRREQFVRVLSLKKDLFSRIAIRDSKLLSEIIKKY